MKKRIVIQQNDIEMGEPILMVLRGQDSGGNLTVVNSSVYEHPGIWGIVLADCVQHIVNAYAGQGLSGQAVREDVLHYLMAELERPTDKAVMVEVEDA